MQYKINRLKLYSILFNGIYTYITFYKLNEELIKQKNYDIVDKSAGTGDILIR